MSDLEAWATKTADAWEAAQEAADELNIPTSATIPQRAQIDADHAVALEREAVAKWLYLSPWIDAEQAEKLMTDIRQGEHWRAT